MSGDPAPVRFSLRRSIYGWGCLAWAALATAFLGYWVPSLFSNGSDLEPIYLHGLSLSSDGGLIRIHSQASMSVEQLLELSETVDNRNAFTRAQVPESATANVPPSLKVALPGFEFRRFQYLYFDGTSWTAQDRIWILSLSPLIPCGVMSVLAILFFYRYVVVGRKLRQSQQGSKLANAQSPPLQRFDA